MAKKKNSLLNDIKKNISKTGSNKKSILYFKSGVKMRVRFLTELDEGTKIVFHDHYEKGINVPCQETFGKECEYCEDETLRTRELFAWTVYDYEANEVKILLSAANSFSPVPALVGMFEAYGTILDRDYIITKTGAQTSTSYSVVPMDKVKFTNKKAKEFSETKLLSIIDKAFPDANADDDDEDEAPKKSKKSGSKKKKKPEPEYDEDDDEDDDDDDDDEEQDYDDMSAKELYKLCIDRDIACKPKKSEAYYIKKLEEFDEFDEDEDDEDEWD